MDSVQPVHSWNESQITDCRRALEIASAIALAIEGGKASIAVREVQNWRNSRRVMPR